MRGAYGLGPSHGCGRDSDRGVGESVAERDTVCRDRRGLHGLLRRVRGLEQLIGWALGGVVDGREAAGWGGHAAGWRHLPRCGFET